MAVTRLTKRSVDALLKADKTYFAYDDQLKGFGVRVTPSGTKSWVVEYRAGVGGRTAQKKRITLGSTETLTPEEARSNARDILAGARLGSDPAEERAKARRSKTVADIVDRYLAEEVKGTRKPSTYALYELYSRGHLKPALGSTLARDLTASDVRKFHRKIGEANPVTANRCIAFLSGAFRWAAKAGEVPDGFNPASGISKFREQARERYLSQSELQRLGAAIEEAETVGIEWEPKPTGQQSKHLPLPQNRRTKIAPHAAAAIRLLIFTGARLREILHLRWTEIDFDRGLILLPDSKTGAKPIVLNAPALAILAELPRLGVYVIAGETAGKKDEKPRADLQKPWSLVTRRADLEGLRIHDLRHTFASFGAGHGLGLPIIGKLLGHKQSETTARYAHLADDPLRRAADAIGATIAGAMGGKQSGQVHKLGRTGSP